jgi:hypothetical protein
MIGGVSTGSPAGSPEAAGARTASAVELALFVGLLLSYIWLWSDAFPGSFFVLLVLYFGLGVEGHVRHGESPRSIGLRGDTFVAAGWLAVRWLAPLVAVGMAVGWWLGGWAFPKPLWSLASVAYGAVWGTLQEYGLVCVLYRRLRELLPTHRAAMLAAGLLFSLFHLANPLLMALTLAVGPVACLIYEREPNLWALGIAHGVVSFCLANSLPTWLTFEWRVGPQILHQVVGLF